MDEIFAWLGTLDDAALQRIANAPADKWNDVFFDSGPDPQPCRCLVGHARDFTKANWETLPVGPDRGASMAYGQQLTRLGVWSMTEISPREVTDPIRAEARRLLAQRRLAAMPESIVA